MRGKPNVARALADQRAIIRAIERRGPLNWLQLIRYVSNDNRLRTALRALVRADCVEVVPTNGWRTYRLLKTDNQKNVTNVRRDIRLTRPNGELHLTALLGQLL